MEDLADLVADGVVDALHVELGGERLLHAVDDRELGGALLAFLEQTLRLVEQPCVFERDAHGIGECLQQADVRLAERVLAFHVGQADQAARLIAGDQRHEHQRFFVFRARKDEAAVLFRLPLDVLVDDQRFTRENDVPRKARFPQGSGLDGDPLPAFINIRVVNQIGLRVVDADADVRLIENLADLVADGVVDALHVELGGERLLHAVDDRELGRALLALLEQALRFVEQAGVFERHAHAVGQRLEQAHVGVAESVLALHVGHADDSARLIADHHRHQDGRSFDLRTLQDVRTVLGHGFCHVLVEDQRFARTENMRGESRSSEWLGSKRQPLPALVGIRIVNQIGLGVVDADPHVPVLKNLAYLVADRVVDALDVELGGSAQPARC